MPPHTQAWTLKKGKLAKCPYSVSEMGVFSSVLIDAKAGKVLENQNFGLLLRTKCYKSNEGGIMSGAAVVDRPWLYEDKGDLNEVVSPLVDDI